MWRVLEKGWLGGGNTGRNTTIIRSNYLWDESAAIYDHALKLWEGLSQELNYNVMFSPRGVLMLAHTIHDIQVFKRHVHANRLNGVDNEWLTPEQCKVFCPPLNIARDIRYPVLGGALQRRGGVARHDAVAWGYARGADRLRRRHHPELRGDGHPPRRFGRGRRGRDDARRNPRAERSASSRPGTPASIMAMAGLRMPLESFPLQALVSEPVKPVFPCVVMSNTIHAYISQSDKGELVIGGGTDVYTSYSQRGALHVTMHTHRGDLRAVPDVPAHAHAAQLGRHRRRDAGPLADHRQDAGARPLCELRLGHRRFQGDAGLGPCVRRHDRERPSRIRSTHRFRSSASATAY